VLADLERATALEPRAAFVIRTMVVHEYRRILLRATALPPELLPAGWPGHTARELAAALYGRVHAAASDYASSVLSNEHGALPRPVPGFFARFGGLDARRAATAVARRAPESHAEHT